MDKLRKNINMLIDEISISAEELSRRIGIPASTIKKVRNYNNANPTLATLSPLAKYFSISISQLIGDEEIPQSRIKGTYNLSEALLYQVPIISWSDVIKFPHERTLQQGVITTEHKYSDNAYALEVEEDSWENLAKNTMLVIDSAIKPDHRDFAIVYKEGQRLPTLKQILFDDGDIYLKPVVAGYGISIFTAEYKFFGVVVEYKKNLKT